MSKLIITMLGEFSLSYENEVVNERTKRSPKMWTLLEYLITFKEREISQKEITELLWGDEKSGENPVGALKTQLHRLRGELKKLGFPENIIINAHGSYAFNKAINYSIDTEEFEKLYKLAVKETDIETKLKLILKAVMFYKGDFLPKFSTEQWASPVNKYYRSLYLCLVHEACGILKAADKPHDVITLCERALVIDPYDEFLHGMFIEMLFKEGNKQGAKSHYQYIKTLFFTKFGSDLSDNLINIYNKAAGTSENKTQNFIEITNSLSETASKKHGTFYCEYEFFKYIYQLEMRLLDRHSRRIGLILITIANDEKDDSAKKESELIIKSKKLHIAIQNSLRKNDIFSRYNTHQFLALIHDANEENFPVIISRIKRKYSIKCAKGKEVLNDCLNVEFFMPDRFSEED